MKLKKLLEINQMCEERKTPYDVQESYTYTSKTSSGEIDILDMDITHFIRAFKLLNKKIRYEDKLDNLNTQISSLHWISDRLTGLASELKEYTDNGN